MTNVPLLVSNGDHYAEEHAGERPRGNNDVLGPRDYYNHGHLALVKVTVLITLLNDPRVLRTLESLANQQLQPFELLVADGGSPAPFLAGVKARLGSLELPGRVEVLPGSVAQSRNRALPLVESEVVAFLDADEVAPPGWLAALAAPLQRADFTGGPTRPLAEPRNACERYVSAFDEWFYRNVVASDITFLPMGNSAWKITLLKSIGGFDERFREGGEDYDANLRAVAAGYKGLFVPEAWVYHDQSHLNSFPKIVGRKYRYSVGATMAYRKNRVLRSKVFSAATGGFRHPLEVVDLLVKPVALIHGTLAWARRGD